MTQQFHIYSGEHRAYWLHPANGYTTNVDLAGRYSYEEAVTLTKHCGPEKKIRIVPAKYNFTDVQRAILHLFDRVNISVESDGGIETIRYNGAVDFPAGVVGDLIDMGILRAGYRTGKLKRGKHYDRLAELLEVAR